MAVRPETADLLRQLYHDLRQPNPFPEQASEAEQDVWIAQAEADSWLAGLLSRATAHGRVTREEVEEGRALSTAAGSCLGGERVAAAYELLLPEAL
ncbi:hypothetical protein [Modestobacter versicolor]|uniref:Uncharacterized protein n=1 Tax=Modestobacter versicolor TaxID=429133 RepID=A0A323V722_9ACTN|nr:hypothetical protein [Modestobacter versicolor]MBB3677957.1 hypothetical protein [Modestobacter versicolor]PZA20629.1 hypothetical protein DMO24_14485 [Modestobacter versicolor]